MPTATSPVSAPSIFDAEFDDPDDDEAPPDPNAEPIAPVVRSEPDTSLERLPLPRGRRSSLDKRSIGTIRAALRSGMPLSQTAGLIGISSSTLHSWLRKGYEPEPGDDPLYAELAHVVDFERSQQTLQGVELMKIHALKDPRAARWLLQAQDPHTWGDKLQQKVEVEHTHKKAAEDLSMLTDEELELRARIEEKITAGRLGEGG